MKNAKSLLDGLLGGMGNTGSAGGLGGLLGGGQSGSGGLGGLLGGGQSGGLGQLAGQAREMLGKQSGMTKVAAGGGLLALLLGSKGTRKMAGSALRMGGTAVIGALAYRAWQDWQAGKPAEVSQAAPAAELPAPEGTPFMPDNEDAADDLATRLVQAMVSAAKADGHITDTERAQITEQLGLIGLDAEAEELIASELNKPLDVGHVAGLASTPEEAAEIYAASLLVVDPEGPAEKGYLAMLAARMKMEPELVSHLHARVASLS
ncbi:tellurite resistance TerB family protein [Falsirhodobacter sp. alg1]|uniref:tellurite resistance TerB family protein n=1 Tax=Falsirhodobacter sp. alg1 TaxID=1472418 RepID=UPI0005EEE47E|nr:tellurite resistance TerB family protein [Falsirhodobacter sp. alg1]